MVKAKILSAISSVGWEGKKYGPFDAGQVVDLPSDLVQKLMPQGLVAEAIEEEKPTLATYLEHREPVIELPPKKEGEKPKATSYAKLMELADGGDYLEIFAPAGHGKSRFLAHTTLEAKKAGKRVLFLDSEHSIPRRIQKALGDSYKRLDFMNLDAIINAVANLPEGLDLICYDSIGFPVLIKFVQMSLRERGDAIAKTILLRGHLKHYAEINGALALGTNQPVSELYGMSHELENIEERPPVGGKSIHVAKGVIRMDIGHRAENVSTFGLRAFEMQDLPFNKLLAVFTISGEGERVDWKI